MEETQNIEKIAQQINFEDILGYYDEGAVATILTAGLKAQPEDRELHPGKGGIAAARAVREILRRVNDQDERWLSVMLRDHRKAPIHAADELVTRLVFDKYLSCLDSLEVAITAGIVMEPDTAEPFWKDVAEILLNSQVKLYYESYYPDFLPLLLLKRIKGEADKQMGPATALGLAFVELDKHFVKKLESGSLLLMIDDFQIDGYVFKDVLQLLEQPEVFVKSVMKKDQHRSSIDRAAGELGQFAAFCARLDAFLFGCSLNEPLQMKVWQRYSYWLGITGKRLQKRLGHVLDKFAAWEVPEDDQDQAQEIRDYITRSRSVLDRLVAGNYSRGLREFVAHSPWRTDVEEVTAVEEESPATVAKSLKQLDQPSVEARLRRLEEQFNELMTEFNGLKGSEKM
jgi:hypothetical protein